MVSWCVKFGRSGRQTCEYACVKMFSNVEGRSYLFEHRSTDRSAKVERILRSVSQSQSHALYPTSEQYSADLWTFRRIFDVRAVVNSQYIVNDNICGRALWTTYSTSIAYSPYIRTTMQPQERRNGTCPPSHCPAPQTASQVQSGAAHPCLTHAPTNKSLHSGFHVSHDLV
jgi:hypothetical protein